MGEGGSEGAEWEDDEEEVEEERGLRRLKGDDAVWAFLASRGMRDGEDLACLVLEGFDGSLEVEEVAAVEEDEERPECDSRRRKKPSNSDPAL